ncbi:uncharacterized protein LOC110442125 [Mizuhopecten yessoensis]|uniref:uncharacterized protein LOC110442125 n=1 Tax=Mizuhopecten yessoensis TaxID=6573 RepID=UPI000B45D2BD|nr:uncharacterized protein LOC110442125 [Mizuhopecten yessoensis]
MGQQHRRENKRSRGTSTPRTDGATIQKKRQEVPRYNNPKTRWATTQKKRQEEPRYNNAKNRWGNNTEEKTRGVEVHQRQELMGQQYRRKDKRSRGTTTPRTDGATIQKRRPEEPSYNNGKNRWGNNPEEKTRGDEVHQRQELMGQQYRRKDTRSRGTITPRTDGTKIQKEKTRRAEV